MLWMKNENRYNGTYFYCPFSGFDWGKKETWLPLSYFILWNLKAKHETTVYATHGSFPFFLFSSGKRQNHNRYNRSYIYFSFFVWGLGKRKIMLSYPSSIFYHEIKKQKTTGMYRIYMDHPSKLLVCVSQYTEYPGLHLWKNISPLPSSLKSQYHEKLFTMACMMSFQLRAKTWS